MTGIREALVGAMREARTESESMKAIYISPYSGHDALVNFHESRGRLSGLAHAIEILDGMEQS